MERSDRWNTRTWERSRGLTPDQPSVNGTDIKLSAFGYRNCVKCREYKSFLRIFWSCCLWTGKVTLMGMSKPYRGLAPLFSQTPVGLNISFLCHGSWDSGGFFSSNSSILLVLGKLFLQPRCDMGLTLPKHLLCFLPKRTNNTFSLQHLTMVVINW